MLPTPSIIYCMVQKISLPFFQQWTWPRLGRGLIYEYAQLASNISPPHLLPSLLSLDNAHLAIVLVLSSKEAARWGATLTRSSQPPARLPLPCKELFPCFCHLTNERNVPHRFGRSPGVNFGWRCKFQTVWVGAYKRGKMPTWGVRGEGAYLRDNSVCNILLS